MSDKQQSRTNSSHNTEKIRIAKFLSHAGVCSRRDAEKLIDQGQVSVNGKILDTPAIKVGDDDEVCVNGQTIGGRTPTQLFVLYKKLGLVTTHKDEKDRPTVFDSLPKELPRVVSVGRLDMNTEGLLLLTTNGELARYLELPKNAWVRHYRVRIFGQLNQQKLDRLQKGVTINNIKYGSIKATIEKQQSQGKANQWLSLSLREGKNREIRNVMEFLGVQVNRLIRTSFGPFRLGQMKPGDLKQVNPDMLKDFVPKTFLDGE